MSPMSRKWCFATLLLPSFLSTGWGLVTWTTVRKEAAKQATDAVSQSLSLNKDSADIFESCYLDQTEPAFNLLGKHCSASYWKELRSDPVEFQAARESSNKCAIAIEATTSMFRSAEGACTAILRASQSGKEKATENVQIFKRPRWVKVKIPKELASLGVQIHFDETSLTSKGNIVIVDMTDEDATYTRIKIDCNTKKYGTSRQGFFHTNSRGEVSATYSSENGKFDVPAKGNSIMQFVIADVCEVSHKARSKI